MADKKQREKGDSLLDQKKERKLGSKCWVETSLSSGPVEKGKEPAVLQKQRGENTELQREAKETEGTHGRGDCEIQSEQRQENELRKPASLQATSDGKSHVRNASEPLREKEAKPLPQTVHSQNPKKAIS